MEKTTCLIAALALYAVAPATLADIYKYVDKYGRVTLTDRPMNANYKRLVKTWKGWEEAKSRIAIRDFEKNRKKHTPAIDHAARYYGLPTSLVHAVVAAESAYDANAVSRTGAVGLMQLMPETARRYGVGNRRNPADNLNAGTHYLRDLLRKFHNNLKLALAAYNAGENTVERYGNRIPPFEETREYIAKVISYYREYSGSKS
jgi:soluble lytic murein transglycosylase-like protein